MKRIFIFVLIVVMTGIASPQLKKSGKKESAVHPTSVLDFTMNSIDGKPRPLSSYKGHVLMIINTASECGYTPQYETLEKLYETYKAKGFRVLVTRQSMADYLGANNFVAWEPKEGKQILASLMTRSNRNRQLYLLDAEGKAKAMRRLGLAGTELAEAQCQTIRLKLLKIGALVRVTVRKVWVSLASSCPYAEVFRRVHENLARSSPLILRC